jgi:dihydrofolate reductase
MNCSVPDGWVAPDGTAFDWPVFVLTHEVGEPVTKGKTPFTFVSDGVESAFAKAREVARDKNIGLHGATVAQQFLKAGLVDEIHLHVVPVLLGGTRLFDQLGIDHIELEQTRMLETPSVTHLSYRTVRDS